MDRLEIVKQLESLRDHCQSMVDANDPASIWWGDTEALTAAIEALSLDINKTQKGDINMTSKAKATIETPDGPKEFTADTVICFTVDKAREVLTSQVKVIEASAAYVGLEIPGPIFADTVGALIGDTVEKVSSNKVRASFELHKVAQILEAKSKALKKDLTEQEKAHAFADAFIDMLMAGKGKL